MGETLRVRPTITPLVVPGVQATEHQIKALGDQKQTQIVGDHERRVETELPPWLQPSRNFEQGDLQVRQTYLQLSWQDHLQQFSFPRILQETCFKQIRRKAQFLHSFFERPELRSKPPHASYDGAMQKKENLTIGRRELRLPTDLGI